MSSGLDHAQSGFLKLVETTLPTQESRAQFSSWLRDTALPALEGQGFPQDIVDSRNKLETIAAYLRTKVPSVEAVMPTEHIMFPTSGDDAALNEVNCVHVDGFLFDEPEEDRLVEEGKLSRNYCKKCGSHDTEELRYITHSCSKTRLEYIFKYLLPPLHGKHLLDVGSRLGAVLYGAYAFSAAHAISGLELNEDLCRLQSETVARFGMGDRIRILHRELTTCPEAVAEADVIVLNNVFEWFMPPELQVEMWGFLYQYIKKGALIVSIPPVEQALKPLQTGIDYTSWLRPLNPAQDVAEDDDTHVEVGEVKLYEVINTGMQ